MESCCNLYNTRWIIRGRLKLNNPPVCIFSLDTELISILRNLIRFPQTTPICSPAFFFKDSVGNWMFHKDNEVCSEFLNYLKLNFGDKFNSFIDSYWSEVGFDVYFKIIDTTKKIHRPLPLEIRLGDDLFLAFCEFAFTDPKILFSLLREIKNTYQEFIKTRDVLKYDYNFWKVFSFDNFEDYKYTIRQFENKVMNLFYKEIYEEVKKDVFRI